MSEQHSVAVGKAANEHETAPREIPLNSSASTLYEFALGVPTRWKTRWYGLRDVIEIHETKKTIVRKVDSKDKSIEKTWLYYEMSPYKMMTYQELIWVMHDMGRGLAK
nr:BAF_HP1_G0046990.mRNA.1.CDS.1 [Saccharomyces cerevisiae]